MEAPSWTPALFSGKGTGSATIDMGNEVGRTDQHSGAWRKRLRDRRGVLAVRGAVRRCGMDGLIDSAPLQRVTRMCQSRVRAKAFFALDRT